jgi:hypothetical protein
MISAELLQTSQYAVSQWTPVLKIRSHLLRLDWHQQKVNNPWLLPSLNQFLSKMDGTSWKLTPNHSNLVEGGHLGTNDVTSIGKEIGEAVTRYF